jgi:hypothetical protein
VSLKNTAVARQPFVADSDPMPGRVDSEHARHVCRQLEVAGVEPLLLLKNNGVCANVAALAVNAAATFGSDVAVTQLHEQVFALLGRGFRLSVAVTALGSEAEAPQRFRRLCGVLKSAARDACASASAIEIAIEADALTPRLIWLIRREILGAGSVYLIADGESMNLTEGRPTREDCEQFWLQLWQLRDTSEMRAACASMVSSPCPLLSAEVATNILPSIGVQVPAGTAWVPMRLDLGRFADARGHVQESALEYALHCCIEVGDVLHDLMRWPTAMMRHDAWQNRRLAILVTGIGDLAVRRQLDPQQFRCLQSLDELLCWVKQTLHTRSRQIARETSCLPALDLGDPSSLVCGRDVRDDWQIRWRHAVDQGAVRHRNLMVLSPWSLFPADQPADMRYADLLPLVAYGDACAFSRSATLGHWNINEFKSFHQRAWAALQQRDAAALIAEQV